jgi:hypothetical protein
MILKYLYRAYNQTRAVYFSGWENTGKVNHPFTAWLDGAKKLSKTEAEKEAPIFLKICHQQFGTGKIDILKENRSKRAGIKG